MEEGAAGDGIAIGPPGGVHTGSTAISLRGRWPRLRQCRSWWSLGHCLMPYLDGSEGRGIRPCGTRPLACAAYTDSPDTVAAMRRWAVVLSATVLVAGCSHTVGG